MKRNIAIAVHFLAVLIVAWALNMLHGYQSEESGIEWIAQTSFEDSAPFSGLVSADISNLRRLAVLKNAFEDEGGVDIYSNVVFASTSNGTIAYKLSDLISQAAKYGYTLDQETHTVKYRETSDGAEPYELKVTYKLYDPYYFNFTEVGPGQGVTNIKDLSIEVLRALSEYYSLSGVYDTSMTNFQYRISFETDGGYEIVLDNTSYTTEELKKLGRYLIVSGDGTVQTDIVPEPAGILDAGSGFSLESEDDNLIEIGIDTSYIFSDRYQTAAERFNEDRGTVLKWLYVLIAGFLAAALSAVFAVRGFSEKDREELAMDRLPLEALVFILGAASVALYLIFRFTVYNVFSELIRADELEFWRESAKGVIIWILFVIILSSMYRRSLHGGVWSRSLINGFYLAATDAKRGHTALSALKKYLAILLPEGLILALTAVSYLRRPESPIYPIAMYIGIILLIAFNIFIYVLGVKRQRETDEIRRVTGLIASGSYQDKLDTGEFKGEAGEIAGNINNIADGLRKAVDEQVKADKLKADLITNVSHDIRTPLTSIINYVDLIKREEPEDPTIAGYVDVLEQKSARLKNLTDDLIEASKASSGNIKLDIEEIDLGELAAQAGGELKDKFVARGLELELAIPDEPSPILADGRYLYRVLENLYNNAAKYSLEGTRVYAEVRKEPGHNIFTIKNVSAERLNITPDELTERFVRGDSSRNTEGSGLGLSISKSLAELMGGKLLIEIDGDLYKASVIMDAT